jgi:hypothetical protein
LARLLLATVAALAIGCSGQTNEPVENTVKQAYDFPLGGELTVRNAEGSIRIYGSNHPGMQLIAVRKAYSHERLNKIEIKVLADAGATKIDTIFPPKKEGWGFGDRSGTVDYIIVVPNSTRIRNLEMTNGEIAVDGLRGGSARARLITGHMFSHNCFGNLDLAVTRGRLDISYDWWEPQTFAVEGALENGNINVYIPPGSSFNVDAEAKDGDILDYFGETNERREDGTRLKATFGSGSGPSFRIRTADGDIHFEKAY